MLSFDHSELDALALDLVKAPARVLPAIIPAVNRAGMKIKATMKADASGHRHLPDLARTVGYDVTVSPLSASVEVGFAKTGQGNLANIAAFGTSNNAPVMDITRGLYEELPFFMRAIAKAGADAL
jgi:hypothetical protein